MLWVKELLGAASWMANPYHADAVTGLLRLAHCTIARSLVTGWELRSHFESGLGVAIAGDLPPGPVRTGAERTDSGSRGEPAVGIDGPGVPDRELDRAYFEPGRAPFGDPPSCVRTSRASARARRRSSSSDWAVSSER